MELDEKIASIKLERRKAQEKAAQEALQEADTRHQATLEEVMAQMETGAVDVNGKELQFTKSKYLNGKLEVYLPMSYLKQQQNNLNSVVFVNEGTGISFTANHMQNPGKKQTFEQFKTGMQQGFKQQMGLFVEWLDEGQIKHGELTIFYGTYKVPTGKGNTYNMIFYVQKAKNLIMGNYNCFEKDYEMWENIMKATLHLIEINM